MSTNSLLSDIHLTVALAWVGVAILKQLLAFRGRREGRESLYSVADSVAVLTGISITLSLTGLAISITLALPLAACAFGLALLADAGYVRPALARIRAHRQSSGDIVIGEAGLLMDRVSAVARVQLTVLCVSILPTLT